MYRLGYLQAIYILSIWILLSSPANAEQILPVSILKDGSYFDSAFLNTLTRTYSVAAAEQAGSEVHELDISQEDGQTSLNIGFNFHEGTKCVFKEGICEDGNGNRNRIQVLDDSHFIYAVNNDTYPSEYISNYLI